MSFLRGLLRECDLLQSFYAEDVFKFSESDRNSISVGFVAIPRLSSQIIIIGPSSATKLVHTAFTTPVEEIDGVFEYRVSHLPPVNLEFSESAEDVPSFALDCVWLPRSLLFKLENELRSLFNNSRDESPLWFCCEFLEQDSVSFLFPPKEENGNVLIDLHSVYYDQDRRKIGEILEILLDRNNSMLQTEFNNSSHECCVCAGVMVGRKFLRLTECGHAFCRDCLNTSFISQVEEGINAGCPTCLLCGEEAAQHDVRSILSPPMFERYEQILFSRATSLMEDVVACPRPFCGTPVLLDSPILGRCSKCQFCFCSRCRRTYHGPIGCFNEYRLEHCLEIMEGDDHTEKVRIIKLHGKAKLDKMLCDSRSLTYMQKKTQRCPKCAAPIQKLTGCNKMHCSLCNTLFCWLCLKFLTSSDPYLHFRKGECSGKLFNRHEIDEDNI